MLTVYALGCAGCAGEKQDGTPPLSPLRAPSPPLDGRPQRPAAHDQCHLKRSPLRLEGAPPRYYLSGASRDLTTDFDNVHIPFPLGSRCFERIENYYSEPVVLRSVRRSPPIRMPKGGSLAYLFDGTEVQPVSLPPSGNTQLGEKRTPHERSRGVALRHLIRSISSTSRHLTSAPPGVRSKPWPPIRWISPELPCGAGGR